MFHFICCVACGISWKLRCFPCLWRSKAGRGGGSCFAFWGRRSCLLCPGKWRWALPWILLVLRFLRCKFIPIYKIQMSLWRLPFGLTVHPLEPRGRGQSGATLISILELHLFVLSREGGAEGEQITLWGLPGSHCMLTAFRVQVASVSPLQQQQGLFSLCLSGTSSGCCSSETKGQVVFQSAFKGYFLLFVFFPAVHDAQ